MDPESQAIEIFAEPLNGPKGEEQIRFLQMIATIAICAMRSGYGDEFCRRFLDGAIADLNKPADLARSERMEAQELADRTEALVREYLGAAFSDGDVVVAALRMTTALHDYEASKRPKAPSPSV